MSELPAQTPTPGPSKQTLVVPSELLLGLGAYLGMFLLIPLWDLYALVYTILTGLRAARGDIRLREKGVAALLRPIRRLVFLLMAYGLALIGFGTLVGGVVQPGPFGFGNTGLLHLDERLGAGGPCCELSVTLSPDTPVAEVIAEAWPNTLRTLAETSVVALLLVTLMLAVTLWLHSLSKSNPITGRVVQGALRLGTFRVMLAPLFGAGLVALLFLGIQWKIFPIGGPVSISGANAGSFGDRVAHLALPSLLLAMIPSVLAAQAGARMWLRWEEEQRRSAGRWSALAMETARAFYDQAGWILGGMLLIDPVFALPGIARLLIDSIFQQDAPVLIGAMSALPLLLLIARARVVLLEGAQYAFFVDQPPGIDLTRRKHPSNVHPRQVDRVWLAIAVLLLLIPLVGIIQGMVASPYDPQEMDQEGVFAPPSDAHPLGQDELGRDVKSRALQAQRTTLGIALGGALIAVSLGGLWGGLGIAVRDWIKLRFTEEKPRGRKTREGSLVAAHLLSNLPGDLLRLPAEAVILLHPVLVALAFSIARYSHADQTGQYVGGVGLAVGLALVPRMVWTIEHLWDAAPPDRSLSWKLGGALAIGFGAAVFVAFQYSVAIDALNLGIQSNPATLGNVLSQWQEIVAGTAAVDDARFYVLSSVYSARAGMMALALFMVQDALNDVFGFRSKGIIPRLNG